MPELDALLDGFRKGDRLALSKLLSRVANGDRIPNLPAAAKFSRIIAFTGSGGVGKSTLIGKLIELLRGQQLKVAVLACDPQSPLSGGALLGDRFRMPSRPEDDGVFIRSLAALSGRGALAEHLPTMVHLLEAFSFDVVIIETVGAGQGDTAASELADVVVLLLQPETGDDLQWEKAGVLEVADVIAIHKADLPGAEQTAAQVRAALDLPGLRPIPVVSVSAKTGAGVKELWTTISACNRRRDRQAESHRELVRLVMASVARRFDEALKGEKLNGIVDDWQAGRLTDEEASAAVLKALGR
ncbi:MAG TPA: GTP-binding protein [Gemmataceae bacterium]|nr:GTP-binding protein [Gemmataceae bacterium]